MSPKLQYLAISTLYSLTRANTACPSCGDRRSAEVARKYLVTSLRRCLRCCLLFRSPTTPPKTYSRYYQKKYTSGLTTVLPDECELAQYTAVGFAGTEKDFSRYGRILDALGVRKGARILDYGCSWGYGCWQFEQRGYEVVGFDLSEPRVAYGREKLGLQLESDSSRISGKFDVFFSTHVVEHVPEAARLLNFAFSRLKHDGLFVAVTPNGSSEYRARKPENWARVWGFKHPILFDEVFLESSMNGLPYLATTRLNDFAIMSDWAPSNTRVVDDMTGWELLIAARAQNNVKRAE